MTAQQPRASAFHGLHVLADDDPRWSVGPVEQARAACRGGAHVVQLRAKHATDSQALTWAREIRELTREYGAEFVVNDRYDLALASGADAVHLGQTDLSPASLPPMARRHLAVGCSTHDLDQARATRALDVDYVAFGPVFETASKESEYRARGLELLKEIASLVAPRPLVAIGGIDASNAREVVAAGVCGIAVISAVAAAADPVTSTRALVALLSPLPRGQNAQ